MNATPPIRFRPDRVAYYEAAGWQAYYDHRWARAFWLMVRLNREEFRMPPLAAVAAALDIVRASIAFAPADNDVPKASRYVRRYYEKARRSTGLNADAQTLSDLEMRYWVVHRELALERIQQREKENLGPIVEALTDLHAAIFEISPQAARRSAELRAMAAKTVDRITGRYSTDIAGDWRRAESYLQQAYGAVIGR
jgi:hypothetical protein